MSAIYRRDAYVANKTQTGELKLEENLSATAYLALIRFLRREKLAEKPDLLERVKNVITDTMPYRAAFKQKRFVEQLTCPEEKFESMIFEKNSYNEWRDPQIYRMARHKLGMRVSNAD